MYLYEGRGVTTRLWAGQSGANYLCVEKFFYFHKTFRLVQRRTQPHSICIRSFYLFQSGCSIRNLTTHLHLEKPLGY